MNNHSDKYIGEIVGGLIREASFFKAKAETLENRVKALEAAIAEKENGSDKVPPDINI